MTLNNHVILKNDVFKMIDILIKTYRKTEQHLKNTVKNNLKYPTRKYGFSFILLNVPDFPFALGNFSYSHLFPYAGMGKIIHKYGKLSIACMG